VGSNPAGPKDFQPRIYTDEHRLSVAQKSSV
jgi:hypothetical protein